jgi:hypothetical protein
MGNPIFQEISQSWAKQNGWDVQSLKLDTSWAPKMNSSTVRNVDTFATPLGMTLAQTQAKVNKLK